MSAASAAWRAATQEKCDRCRRQLSFLEGPVCDGCLNEEEQSYPAEKYYARLRSEEHEVARHRSPLLDRDAYDSVDPCAGDALSVNFETGEVRVFPRRAPVTRNERRRA